MSEEMASRLLVFVHANQANGLVQSIVITVQNDPANGRGDVRHAFRGAKLGSQALMNLYSILTRRDGGLTRWTVPEPMVVEEVS